MTRPNTQFSRRTGNRTLYSKTLLSSVRPIHTIIGVCLIISLVMISYGLSSTERTLSAINVDEHSSLQAILTALKNNVETKKDDMPYFILHVGPSKTGTTFLQWSLGRYQPQTQEMLSKEDGYIYIGKGNRPYTALPKYFRDLWRAKRARGGRTSWYYNPNNSNSTHDNDDYYTPEADQPGQKIPEAIKRVSRRAAASHENVILSDEYLAGITPQGVQALAHFLNPLFHVRVVMYYRRLYEWVLSVHNQHEKLGRKSPPWNATRSRPFDFEFIDDEYTNNSQLDSVPNDIIHDVQKTQQHVVQMVYNKFAHYFDDVLIINKHKYTVPMNIQASSSVAIDPQLHSFLCTAIPTAMHTCQALEQGQLKDISTANPSTNLAYDQVATAAFQKGWIDGASIDRTRAVSKIQSHDSKVSNRNAKKTLADFPRICLSEAKMNRLLELSMTVERNLFGEQAASSWEAEHRQGFEAMKSRGLCRVDTKAVLEDPEWESFLKSLTGHNGKTS